jgi:hypothetical protein
MVKQLPFPLLILFFIISCNSHPRTAAGSDSLVAQRAATSQTQSSADACVLTISPAMLNKFEAACRQDTLSYDKKFVSNFVDLVKRFSGRKLDTTILSLGNITGGPHPDSIFTRVYLDGGEIKVDSKWLKNGRLMWRDTITGPYTELQADLVDSTRNPWVFFGIGVFYGPPNFYPEEKAVDPGASSLVISAGLEDLKALGIKLDTAQYKEYLREFKGDVFTRGQPESRERLWIWYKPAGKMITYYQP